MCSIEQVVTAFHGEILAAVFGLCADCCMWPLGLQQKDIVLMHFDV